MKIIYAVFLLFIIAISACTTQVEENADNTENVGEQTTEQLTPPALPDNQGTQEDESDTTSTPPLPPTDVQTEDESETLELEMIARNWEFVPSTIEVKVGQPVTLKVMSIDNPHGIAIPAFDIQERLEPNEEVVVTFTPDTAGSFPFFCSVACGSGHRNMKGVVEVVE